jgi:dipeptidase D
MSTTVRDLEPKAVWGHFADLNAIPRPSKKEERVRAFMVAFGESLGLPTMVDDIGNVIIKKPASPGMEDRTIVVLQSHLDMVHQKNASTDFDFDKQGIDMYVDGDWVKANGTTLGADNGMGVAAIMTLLKSKDIAHPPLEALFTIDEETGMTGAIGLKGGLLDGGIMLNLDTEDDDELSIGCAGGIDVTVTRPYDLEKVPAGMKAYKIVVNGLNGGHSGMDIHKGLGNANKIMNRVLWRTHEHFGLRIAQVDGGSLRNAIPRESFSTIVVREEDARTFEKHIAHQEFIIKKEYSTTDPNLKIAASEVEMPAKVMDVNHQEQILRAIYACQNGIYRMSPDIPGLVQTSNNVARVQVANGVIKVLCLTRSSVDSEKMDLAHSIEANFFNIGAEVELSGSYPGWTPAPDSHIVKLMTELYQEKYNETPKVMACHAGLECGILGTHYPEMQMISFGPNIRGAHSPDEKVQISSVQKFWAYLLETLKRIPKAA